MGTRRSGASWLFSRIRATASLRGAVARAGTVIAGVLLVLGLAIPAGAEGCTSTDTTLASSDCEGTVSVTTEDDTATVSTSLSVQTETDDGPVDAHAGATVEEERTTDTPSYQGEEREVTVPGTQTPELTVTTPRVDIREPIDLQAGGQTTAPSVSIDERTVTTGGTRYGVPDQEVTIDLFGSDDPQEGTTIDQPIAEGIRGGFVEGSHTGSSATGTPVSGPDGHLTGDRSATSPASSPSLGSGGPFAGTSASSISTETSDRDGSVAPAPWGTHGWAALERGGQLISDAASVPAGRGMTAWLAIATMIALAGTGYLLAQRRSPLVAS